MWRGGDKAFTITLISEGSSNDGGSVSIGGNDRILHGVIQDDDVALTGAAISISGDHVLEQGKILTAIPEITGDQGASVRYSYQWFVTDEGNTFDETNNAHLSRDQVTGIRGTEETFTLTQDEVGKTITLRVTASYQLGTGDGGDSGKTLFATTTGTVANVNDDGMVTLSIHDANGNIVTATDVAENHRLTAIPDDLDGFAGQINYQWLADGVDIDDATSVMFELTQAQVGKVITVRLDYLDGFGVRETPVSVPTDVVANVDDDGSVTITGSLSQGALLTATVTDEDGTEVISYQWFADGMAITGAIGKTYRLTQDEVGDRITVEVKYTDLGLTSETLVSTPTVPVVDVNDDGGGDITVPQGTTALQQGVILEARLLSDDDGKPTTGITYQWYTSDAGAVDNPIDATDPDEPSRTLIQGAGGVDVAGKYLTLTQAHVGKQISVTISYQDDGGFSNTLIVGTSQGSPVLNVNDLGVVTISNTAPIQGETLTASVTDVDGDPADANIDYQWLADGVDISGATGKTFTPGENQVDAAISVRVSYDDALTSGLREIRTSVPTDAVANIPAEGEVTISGTVAEDQTLTAIVTDGDGNPDPGDITYKWTASGSTRVIGRDPTFILTQDQVGKTITVTASYNDVTDDSLETLTATTSAVANVPDAGVVTISRDDAAVGTAAVFEDQTLKASVADADGLFQVNIAYRWSAGGTEIMGARGGGNTLILTQSEVGKVITVTASYTDNHGPAETQTSAATAAVTDVPHDPVGLPAIGASATQGQMLTADTSVITDADGLGTGGFSYQWKAGNTKVGADRNTFTPGQSEVGEAISVVVTYTDGGGKTETLPSAATSAVTNVNDDPTGAVTISGTPTEGRVLMAANTLADADGLGTLSYQWQAGGTDIAGATEMTLTLTQAQVDKDITVVVSYTDGFDKDESVTSDSTDRVANVNDDPTGEVTISGGDIVQVGRTLTAFTDTIMDADGLRAFNYQWRATDGTGATTDIAGAISKTFTLTAAQLGKKISVMVTYTDGPDARPAGERALETLTSVETEVTVSTADNSIRLSDIARTSDGRGFVINGALAGEQSGFSVSSAGDIDGDGYDDLIVGVPNGGGDNVGRSYVVFGELRDGDAVSLKPRNLNDVNRGFSMTGEGTDSQSGFSVSSAGDVNGDGLDDLIVKVWPGANARDNGKSYVVFGKKTFTGVDLSDIERENNPVGGFVIAGTGGADGASNDGRSVSGAGDVNGDGYDDLIVGVDLAGKSYVVFGKAGTTAVSLDMVAGSGADSGGFVINGAASDGSGYSVSSAGDVNGDGLDDLIIGAPEASGGGKSYVVYGKAGGGAVNLAGITAAQGFVITGGAVTDGENGFSVSSAGDVNGDGYDDLIVGLPKTGSDTGKSYVIFGSNAMGDVTLTPQTLTATATATVTELRGRAAASTLTLDKATIIDLTDSKAENTLIVSGGVGDTLHLSSGFSDTDGDRTWTDGEVNVQVDEGITVDIAMVM